MKKIMIALMAVTAGLLLTSQVFAWGPYQGGGPGYCRQAGLERLNLTDDQKAKIEGLQTAHEKAIRPLRDKMFDKSVELRRLWLQATPDKNKIVAAEKELRTMRDELQEKRTDMRLEIHKVLTPEQNEKLSNIGWGRGLGFGPRGGIRGPGGCGYGPGLGMGLCQ